MNKNKIIEDFDENFNHNPDRLYENLKSFLLSIPTSILMELRGDVEGRKPPLFLNQDGVTYDFLQADAYKLALSDILALIDKKINELK